MHVTTTSIHSNRAVDNVPAYTVGWFFSTVTNFVDFMDLGTSTKFVSLKHSRNSIVTRIAN